MQPIITLASASPRRKLLIEQMGLAVDVCPVDIEEIFSELPPEEDTVRLAKQKLTAYLRDKRIDLESEEDLFVLAADTIVALEGEKIGKPADRREAESFLRMFSGRTHQVVSGLALYSTGTGITTASAVTDVTFASMKPEEIEWYLDTEEWRGVAAGYRIQERGSRFIAGLSGSYSNVMGLPIYPFYGMLREHGYPVTGQ